MTQPGQCCNTAKGSLIMISRRRYHHSRHWASSLHSDTVVLSHQAANEAEKHLKQYHSPSHSPPHPFVLQASHVQHSGDAGLRFSLNCCISHGCPFVCILNARLFWPGPITGRETRCSRAVPACPAVIMEVTP